MSDQPEELEIYIEWPDQYGIRKAAIGDSIDKLKDESQKAINLAMGTIREMATRVSVAIKDLQDDTRPDEVEVEFSIKLDVEGGVVVPMVAKTTVGGQFNVKLKWTVDKPEKPAAIIRATG